MDANTTGLCASEAPPKRTLSRVLGILGLVLGAASFLTCGLTAFPGFVLSLVGVLRRSRSVWAWLGLAACAPWVLYFLICVSLWSPVGEVYPFNRVRFAWALSEQRFWLDYPEGKLVGVRNRTGLFGASGGLYYQSSRPEAYTADDVAAFAAAHGCGYPEAGDITRQALLRSRLGVRDLRDEPAETTHPPWILFEGQVLGIEPFFWGDCTVVEIRGKGDTLATVSWATVVISRKGDEMAVYCGQGCRD